MKTCEVTFGGRRLRQSVEEPLDRDRRGERQVPLRGLVKTTTRRRRSRVACMCV
eukprot:CAMPEP_0177379666 /NCGR_PEP_ID=MMETSP0368-20130122/47061_1 /TAXON_ID=447022 ORGANISM="Scrippsiella hangoei-like, Strain SHHI-4" /NCGR_SAMPLE_ID=MMETSP0368 /ASSEMBLY_ACC=CAM_ASM_000363 /LENGTH=53 /DNA_ID=CAMNT_0018843841 /DNA_START=98 /DNA_END=256 /DNA_ORIENTATION=+